MKKHIALVSVAMCFLSTCKGIDRSNNVSIRNKSLESLITGFTQNSAVNHSRENVLTVELINKGELTQVNIANAYPDTVMSHIRGCTSLNNFNIFFIGVANKNLYASDLQHSIYAEALLKKIIRAKFGKRPMPGFNYTSCTALFDKQKLLHNTCIL